MATPGADVRSIDALRDWLAALAGYRHAAAEAVAGVDLEIRRGFEWLAEQEAQWKQAVRDRREEVVRAKAELSAKRFPGYDGRMPDTTIEERNLRRAEARLDHAHDQVKTCQAWAVKLPKLVDELYTAPARRLGLYLEGDLTRGAAALDRQVSALESYAGLRPDFAPAPSLSTAPPPGPSKLPEMPKPEADEPGSERGPGSD
jgi:hypothetical protein